MQIKKIAKKLEKMGGKEDTILAHINPEEAQVLKDGGGSGKRNPKTGLLSFGGYEGDGTGMGGGYGADGPQNDGYGGFSAADTAQFGTPEAPVSIGGGYGDYGGGKPGESNMAQAAATRPDMTPEAYAGIQQSMLDAIGKQDAGMMNTILGGLFGPLGSFAGKLGAADYLSQAWNKNSIMGTPYGTPAMPESGGSSGGYFGGNSEGGMGDGGGNTSMAGGTVAAPPAALGGFAPIAQQPFVSKWGKPRARGYFGS
jgi:hypothetical protein